MAALPADLLIPPPDLPPIPRTVDRKTGKATVSGEQCMIGAATLYDVAGGIRMNLIELQAAERARQQESGKTK